MQTADGKKPKLYRAMHLPEHFAAELNQGFSWPEDAAKPDAILLDAGHGQVRGGSGKKFDWQAAVPLVEAIETQIPVIVAGGLDPENVAEAIRLFQPYGVDVVSGVEASPGNKDPAESPRVCSRSAARECDGLAMAIVQRRAPGSVATGRFGPYGGRYVPETLMAALQELESAYEKAKTDPDFQS